MPLQVHIPGGRARGGSGARWRPARRSRGPGGWSELHFEPEGRILYPREGSVAEATALATRGCWGPPGPPLGPYCPPQLQFCFSAFLVGHNSWCKRRRQASGMRHKPGPAGVPQALPNPRDFVPETLGHVWRHLHLMPKHITSATFHSPLTRPASHSWAGPPCPQLMVTPSI